MECTPPRHALDRGAEKHHANPTQMRDLDGELVLSPSDLTGFAACAHLTQLEIRAMRGEITRP